MDYQFPLINTLDDVREAIAGSPEFIVAERDWGYVVNYLVVGPDTFPPVKTAGGSASMRDRATRLKAIRRECRGLIFDRNGVLISRPFSKFFNANERDETQVNRIDLSRPHVILEKLDGSMVRPIPLDNGYRLATKMGITDVAMQAEEFVAGNINYHDFIMLHIERGQTPIFEWCSRKNRVVLDYPIDRLVLTGIRNVNDGAYKSYAQMVAYAEAYGVEVVQARAGNADNMQSLLEETRVLQGQEGWVIRFDDGHMLKVKGEEYVSIHKAKDRIMRENALIEMILDEKLDDVKAHLPDDDRHRVEEFETKFWQGVWTTAEVWRAMDQSVHRQHGADRKAFALSDGTQTMDGNMKSAIFSAWDKADFDWRGAVIAAIRKNLGTSTKVESCRALFGGARWNYAANTGDE
jgi:RNA ligase